MTDTQVRPLREDLRALARFLIIAVPIVLAMIGAMALGVTTPPAHAPAAVTRVQR